MAFFAVSWFSNIHGQRGNNRNRFCSFALKKYIVYYHKFSENITSYYPDPHILHFNIYSLSIVAFKLKNTKRDNMYLLQDKRVCITLIQYLNARFWL